MNSSSEQGVQARPRSGETRQRLLMAATELIAEVGWGRVTTRAVAERAELPLGAVSYHFRGKQELLRQAALDAVEAVFPIQELAAVESVDQLIGSMATSVGERDSSDPGVLLEALREAGRDRDLAERMTTLLAEYRRLLADLVCAEQQHGGVRSDADPAALATLVAAAGDGLLLHGLLDSGVDTRGAVKTLRLLLGR